MDGPTHVQTFLIHRNALLELLNKIPADKADFRAWDDGMTIRELVDHLVQSTEWVRSLLLKEANLPSTLSASLSEAQDRLQTSTERICAALEQLDMSEAKRTVPVFGRQMTVESLINLLLHDHEIHHKGQLWMMARMIGIEPPMFAKLG